MLIERAPDVYTADHDLVVPGGVPFPVRMTVIRLPDRSLVVHSPVPLDDALARDIDALGPVAFLVAPSSFHHLFLPAAHGRYPEARILVAPGVEKKRPELRTEPLQGTLPVEWRDVIQVFGVDGAPAVGETLVLHRPSSTLLITDLAFNLVRPASWKLSLVASIVGVKGRLAQSRAWWMFLKDAPAAAKSLNRAFEETFDRVIPAHGDVVTSNGKRTLGVAITRIPGFRAPA